MRLEAEAVEQALACDADWLRALRRDWLALIELAVWGGIHSAKLGAVPRLRKRLLELGEKLAGLEAPAAWLPQPRERLKSALATALAARELLAQCAEGASDLQAGAPREALRAALAALEARAAEHLEDYASRWAALLDTQLAPHGEE